MSEQGPATDKMHTLQEIVTEARRRLPQSAWDYLVGGAETETSARRNRLAFDRLAFRPRVMTDVSEVSTAGRFLGQPLRIPLLLAPIGSSQLFDPAGGVAVAKAAEEFGVVSFLSSVSEPDFETVAEQCHGPKVYQLYLFGDEEWMCERVERAVEAGYLGFCLTADTQVLGRRERDWLKRWQIPSGSQAGDFGYQSKMTWAMVERFKARFEIPLIVKGIATAEDARLACDLGVDVVYVSNHGGRQLDHTLGTASTLPEVVDAVDGRAEVVVDGSVLRGTDVVKAMALGADAVACGRLYCFGMAAGGRAGIVRTLEILETEITIALGLLGVTSFAELTAESLAPASVAPVRAPDGHLSRAFPLMEFEPPKY